MQINRSNLRTLYTGFQTAFQGAFDGAPRDHLQIAMEVPSTTAEEEYGWLGQTTRFRQWIGDRVIQNVKQHGYTIRNVSYEDTVGVPGTAIRDDRYGVYTPLMAQLGQDAAEHPAELVFGLLAAGFATPCYDGQFFFDTDHPVTDANGVEQSVSNHGGGAGTAWYLLDTTRMIKPIILQTREPYNFVALDREDDQNAFMRAEYIYGVDARLNVGYGLWQLAYGSKQDLDATNFNAALAAMQSMTGDNGKPLGIRPSLLVVPPTLRASALSLVRAENDAAGATNINRDAVDVLVSPWLS
jgi:phage major head subunit gpT-like protein